MSLSTIRSTISSIEGMTIAQEQVVNGQTLLVVDAQGIPFVFVTGCDNGGASCSLIAFIGLYPKNISTSPENINEYNANSALGWLAIDRSSGALVARNSAILSGNTTAGLKTNIQAFIGFYAIVGSSILKQGGGGSTISLDGVDVAPRERIVDAGHQPESMLTLSPEVLKLISQEEAAKGLASVLGDAQTFGRLRKIANDVYGQ